MTDTRSSEPIRTDIERRAYQLYLQREKADGGALEDWIQAEKEVNEDFARNKSLEPVSHDHTSVHATPRPAVRAEIPQTKRDGHRTRSSRVQIY